MKLLKNWVKDYFSFSQREINGFIVLLAILASLLIFSAFTETPTNYSAEQAKNDAALLEKTIASIEAEVKETKKSYPRQYKLYPKKKYTKALPLRTPFNPNTASIEKLQKLGCFPYLAKRIVKYREKGGSFHTKSDLLKIYGFPKKLYDQLEPFIELPEDVAAATNVSNASSTDSTQSEVIKKTPKFFKKKIISFDLATADTVQLKQIRGIGSKLSARIIKRRNALGGFYNLQQLDEIWGLKPEVIEELKKYASLSENTIRQLSVNEASLEELKAHPYIKYGVANAIVNYRAQHGAYQQLEELLNIRLIDQALLTKIKPYLKL